jgi:hypothetical protein
MNNKLFTFLLLVVAVTIISCDKDNFEPPKSVLSGRLTYKGDSIGVEYNQVPFNLFQPGFGRIGAITGTFTPEGTYRVLTFDGDYKFTIPKNQGPFLWKELTSNSRDTLIISLKGAQTVDIEVIPFYMIRKPNFTQSSGKVNATFDIEKIVTDANAKNIQTISLFINKTQFVSNQTNEKLAQADIVGTTITNFSNLNMSVTIPTLPTPNEKYVFARIGVRIVGVEDWIYSPIRKIAL